MKGFKRVWDGLPATDAYFLGWARGTMVAALSDNRRSPTATGQAIGWFVRDAMEAYDAYPPSTSAIPEAEAIETGDCDACDSTVPLDELTTIESSMGETTQCERCRS